MNFFTKARLAVVSGLSVVAGVAAAAPVDLSAGITQIQSDVSGYATAVGPAIVTVAAIVIGIKYAKKFLGKI